MLLQKIRAEKDRLIAEGKIKRDKPLPPITEEEKPFELPAGWQWVRLGDVTNYGTPAKANRMIGGVAPSAYLRKLQEHKQVQLSDAEMDKLLVSHRIPAETLREDAFDAFYQARKGELLKLIEEAMGKAAGDVEFDDEHS